MHRFIIILSLVMFVVSTGAAQAAITLEVPISLNSVPLTGRGVHPILYTLECIVRTGGIKLASLQKTIPITTPSYHSTIEMIIPNTNINGKFSDDVADAYSCFVTASLHGMDVTTQILKGNPIVKGSL